ncbi:UvrD-helicase domain-containing protein [Staphylococcus pasteuri]|uniref:UvrD-helicase domain-containing protein n=1 Tax=Staphylococcus pasteuri TaxID=45972 RepID=UPI0032618BB9
MDKRIVIAAAGAGKTYYVANDWGVNERVILISFTNANVANIRKEVQKRFNNQIPNNVKIMTFDSFAYNNLIKPIEPLLNIEDSTSIDINTTPVEDPRKPGFVKIDNIHHYLNDNNQFYVTRIGKLFLKLKKSTQKIVLDRLENYCDSIYFDEFQDFNGFDFNLLKYFFEKNNLNIVAVGDINQSRLTPLRAAGSSNAKYPFHNINTLDDLKKKLPKKILFDETTLKESRRVPKKMCELIQQKMNIPIESISEIDSSIIYLSKIEDIHQVLLNPNITKLIWDKKSDHPKIKNSINWTYSKGDTYEQSCIILTGSTSNIDKWKDISSQKTKNALYVALTRSKGNTYLLTREGYNNWKKYIDKNGK